MPYGREAAVDPTRPGSAISIMQRALPPATGGMDKRKPGLLALLLAGGAAGSGVPRRRRMVSGSSLDADAQDNTPALGVVVGQRPGFAAMATASAMQDRGTGLRRRSGPPRRGSPRQSLPPAIERASTGIAERQAAAAREGSASHARAAVGQAGRQPPPKPPALRMDLGAVIPVAATRGGAQRTAVDLRPAVPTTTTPAAARQGLTVNRAGRQAIRRRQSSMGAYAEGQRSVAVAIAGTGKALGLAAYSGVAASRGDLPVQDAPDSTGRRGSQPAVPHRARRAVAMAAAGGPGAVAGDGTGSRISTSREGGTTAAGIVPRRGSGASAVGPASAGGFAGGVPPGNGRAGNLQHAGSLRQFEGTGLAFGSTQTQAATGESLSGSSASDGAESGTTIALTGDVVIDGRKLGRISAIHQVSSASLPSRSASAVNIRALPVFAGSSVPL